MGYKLSGVVTVLCLVGASVALAGMEALKPYWQVMGSLEQLRGLTTVALYGPDFTIVPTMDPTWASDLRGKWQQGLADAWKEQRKGSFFELIATKKPTWDRLAVLFSEQKLSEVKKFNPKNGRLNEEYRKRTAAALAALARESGAQAVALAEVEERPIEDFMMDYAVWDGGAEEIDKEDDLEPLVKAGLVSSSGGVPTLSLCVRVFDAAGAEILAICGGYKGVKGFTPAAAGSPAAFDRKGAFAETYAKQRAMACGLVAKGLTLALRGKERG